MKKLRVLEPRAVWRDYDESVVQAMLTSDGHRAITATIDGLAYVHYVNGTGQASTRFSPHGTGHGHDGMINGVSISVDGNMAATAGMDGRVCIWDTATAMHLAAFQTPDATTAADVAIAQNSQTIAAAFVHPALYDALPKATVAIFDLKRDHKTTAASCTAQWSTTVSRRLRMDISADGSMLAHTCARGVVVMATSAKREKIGQWATKGDTSIALNPQANSIAIADSFSLRVASLSEKKVKFFKPYETPLEPAVAFGAQGKRVAAAVKGGIVRIWSALTGAHLVDLKGPADDITDISMSENGRFILGSCFDKRTYLWEVLPVNSHFSSPAPYLSMSRRNLARKSFYRKIGSVGRDHDLLHTQAKKVLENLIPEADLNYLAKYSIAETLSNKDAKALGTIDENVFLESLEAIENEIIIAKQPTQEEILREEFLRAAGHLEMVVTVPIAAAILKNNNSQNNNENDNRGSFEEDEDKIREVLASNSNGICVSYDEFIRSVEQLTHL